MACWRWSNFLESLNEGEKPILHINVDESSLKMHVALQPGLVVEPCPKRRKQMLREGQGADLGTRRAAVSLIAFACNVAALQPLLPQVLVCNERLMGISDLEDVASQCGPSIWLVRRRSSWVNAAFMVAVIRFLAKCLENELPKYHTVLHLDTCPAHLHESVLSACSVAGIHVHFVAALTTAWLQPLDVAIFAPLKAWIAREVEAEQLASATGEIARPAVLSICVRGVRAVLQQGDWGRAFEMCGLAGQGRLSKRLMARLAWDAPPAVESGLPSLADLVAIFPAGANIPIESLFHAVLAKASPQPSAMLRLPRSARLPAAPPHP